MDRNYLSSAPTLSFGCSPSKVDKMEGAQHVTQMLNYINSSAGLKSTMSAVSPQLSTSPQMPRGPQDGKWSLCNDTRTLGWQDTLVQMVSFSFGAMMQPPLTGPWPNTPFRRCRSVPKTAGFANNPPAFFHPFIPTGMIASQMCPSNNSPYNIPAHPFLSLYNSPESQYESSMMHIYSNCKLPTENFSLPLKKTHKLNPEAAEYIPKAKDPIPQSHSVPNLHCVGKNSTSAPASAHCSDSLTLTQCLPSALSQHQQQAEGQCLTLERSNFPLNEQRQSGITDSSCHSKMPCKDSCLKTIQKASLVSQSLSTNVPQSDPMLSTCTSQCGKEELFMPVSSDSPASCELTKTPKSKMDAGMPINFSYSFTTDVDPIVEICDDDCTSRSSSPASTSSDELYSNSSYSDNVDSNTSLDERTESDDELGVFFQDDLTISPLVLAQIPRKAERSSSRASSSTTCTSFFAETESDDDEFVLFEHDLPDAPLVLSQGPGEDSHQRSRSRNCTNSCSTSFTDSDDDDDEFVFFQEDLPNAALILAHGPGKDRQQRSRNCANSCSTTFTDDDDFVFFQDDVPNASLVLAHRPSKDSQQRSKPSNCTSCSISFTDSDDADEFDVFFQGDQPDASVVLEQGPGKNGQQRSSNCTTTSHQLAIGCNLIPTHDAKEDKKSLRRSNYGTNVHKAESITNQENSKKNAPSPQQPGCSILSYLLETTLSEDSSPNDEDWPEDDSNYESEFFNLELDDSWQNQLGGLVISQICPGKNIDTAHSSSKSGKEEFQTDSYANNLRHSCPEKIPTKVRFRDEVETHVVENWDRAGEWEQHARDRMRFRTRIEELESILAPILDPAHRWRVFASQKQP